MVLQGVLEGVFVVSTDTMSLNRVYSVFNCCSDIISTNETQVEGKKDMQCILMCISNVYKYRLFM